jgi:hypothetical protein
MIGSGEVEPRPGVLRLMDEARDAGLKVAVCSAATKSSVVYTLTSLLGKQRFEELDCFLAGEGGTQGGQACNTLHAGSGTSAMVCCMHLQVMMLTRRSQTQLSTRCVLVATR